jgi:hypothetical protein
MLGVSGVGHLFPPFIIFKGEPVFSPCFLVPTFLLSNLFYFILQEGERVRVSFTTGRAAFVLTRMLLLPMVMLWQSSNLKAFLLH